MTYIKKFTLKIVISCIEILAIHYCIVEQHLVVNCEASISILTCTSTDIPGTCQIHIGFLFFSKNEKKEVNTWSTLDRLYPTSTVSDDISSFCRLDHFNLNPAQKMNIKGLAERQRA